MRGRSFGAVALIALLFATRTCGPPASATNENGDKAPNGQPVAQACSTIPGAPIKITFAGKAAVEGETESSCDLPPQEHNVQVFLEVKKAGQWVVQPDPYGKTAGNCFDIPAAGLPKTCKWIITICYEGEWRTRVTVFGHGPATEGYPNGIPFVFPKQGDPPVVSPTSHIVCK